MILRSPSGVTWRTVAHEKARPNWKRCRPAPRSRAWAPETSKTPLRCVPRPNKPATLNPGEIDARPSPVPDWCFPKAVGLPAPPKPPERDRWPSPTAFFPRPPPGPSNPGPWTKNPWAPVTCENKQRTGGPPPAVPPPPSGGGFFFSPPPPLPPPPRLFPRPARPPPGRPPVFKPPPQVPPQTPKRPEKTAPPP